MKKVIVSFLVAGLVLTGVSSTQPMAQLFDKQCCMTFG